MRPDFIPVGAVVNAHGIRGEVKVNPTGFDPEFIASFKTLYIGGQPVKVISARVHKSTVLLALPGVATMDDALALKGKTVSIRRTDAKLPKGQYFDAELEGCTVLDDATGEELGKLDKVHVFGNDYPTPDGTGVRDYIHVVDLARGHVCAIRKLETNCGLFICNLGTGKGYSVLEVLHAFEKACGKQIPYVIDPRRPGDIAECYADPTKAKNELGWVAQYGIEDMCADSWNWQQKNPDGYNTAK